MNLTKHAHACISIEDRGAHILLDPGTFTPNAHELLARADVVLVTHSHFDHFDAGAVVAALGARPELQVFGPADVINCLTEAGANADQAHSVSDHQRLNLAGFDIAVFGGSHANIHEGIAVPTNVGYLIADTVYHPGDSYVIPDAPVHTLLIPSSGPWTKVAEAIDFVRAIAPRQTVPIHDVLLSEVGVRSFAMFLGESGLTGIPLRQLAPGDSVEI